ncbi:MAG TPA: hypothetical protein VJ911_08800, partial [Cryomorphaceae bacterium]|nr:hypothetical protein [Cryomorphaceae bacterium]
DEGVENCIEKPQPDVSDFAFWEYTLTAAAHLLWSDAFMRLYAVNKIARRLPRNEFGVAALTPKRVRGCFAYPGASSGLLR